MPTDGAGEVKKNKKRSLIEYQGNGQGEKVEEGKREGESYTPILSISPNRGLSFVKGMAEVKRDQKVGINPFLKDKSVKGSEN